MAATRAAAALICAAVGCNALANAADDDPREWLARTDRALATRNYAGVFVHEHAGQTETLQVIHRISGGAGAERLLSMDGSGREFIRKGAELICYLPDQRTVLVEKSPDSGLLLGGLPRVDASSIGQYEVKLVKRTRVSGRYARVITVMPMDELRYAYKLWIDEATAMPLKSQLRNGRGEVLEQIVFTSLTLPRHIADAMLEPAVDAREYRWVRHDDEAVAERNAGADRGAGVSWQAKVLPPGFHMTASATQVLPGASGPVEHLVFSDGLASVSVFVEMQSNSAAAAAKDDTASLGSSSAYSTVVEGYRVTAIGEVPPDTVRAIAQSMRAAAAGSGSAASAGTAGATGIAGGANPGGHGTGNDLGIAGGMAGRGIDGGMAVRGSPGFSGPPGRR